MTIDGKELYYKTDDQCWNRQYIKPYTCALRELYNFTPYEDGDVITVKEYYSNYSDSGEWINYKLTGKGYLYSVYFDDIDGILKLGMTRVFLDERA
jgi:hypothetical protein